MRCHPRSRLPAHAPRLRPPTCKVPSARLRAVLHLLACCPPWPHQPAYCQTKLASPPAVFCGPIGPPARLDALAALRPGFGWTRKLYGRAYLSESLEWLLASENSSHYQGKKFRSNSNFMLEIIVLFIYVKTSNLNWIRVSRLTDLDNFMSRKIKHLGRILSCQPAAWFIPFYVEL